MCRPLLQFALCATFIALCATAQPSPFAAPMSYYLVYGVTDETWRSFCEYFASKGVTEYGMIAWGIPGTAAAVYWFNGLLLLALGGRPFPLAPAGRDSPPPALRPPRGACLHPRTLPTIPATMSTRDVSETLLDLRCVALRGADSYWRPEVLSQFKIQKGTGFDTAKLWKVSKNILINQLLVTLPCG